MMQDESQFIYRLLGSKEGHRYGNTRNRKRYKDLLNTSEN